MKSTKNFLSLTGFVFLFLTLCSINVNAQVLKDLNGKSYPICRIGTQVWSAENLNVNRFRNGDVIPQAKSNEEWAKAGKDGKPAWCYYSNDTALGRKYGMLYNYYAVIDPRGLAPAGWHIPDNANLAKLIATLGGIDVAGLKLKSINIWKQQFKGTNISRFTAIPGGFRNTNGKFQNLNETAQWWSTSGDVAGGPDIWSIGLNSFSVQVGYFEMDKGSGLSVRCIKD